MSDGDVRGVLQQIIANAPCIVDGATPCANDTGGLHAECAAAAVADAMERVGWVSERVGLHDDAHHTNRYRHNAECVPVFRLVDNPQETHT